MVGAVTRIHTEDGQINVTDIDKDLRSKWANTLANCIQNLDGVNLAAVSSLSAPANFQVGSIEVIVNSESLDRYVHLDVNPRSFSPQLRAVCDEYEPLSTYAVSSTPTAVNASNSIYDSNYYIIDVNFY